MPMIQYFSIFYKECLENDDINDERVDCARIEKTFLELFTRKKDSKNIILTATKAAVET